MENQEMADSLLHLCTAIGLRDVDETTPDLYHKGAESLGNKKNPPFHPSSHPFFPSSPFPLCKPFANRLLTSSSLPVSSFADVLCHLLLTAFFATEVLKDLLRNLRTDVRRPTRPVLRQLGEFNIIETVRHVDDQTASCAVASPPTTLGRSIAVSHPFGSSSVPSFRI
jgi:hypothetical protein